MSSTFCIRDLLTEEMTPRRLQLPRSATHDHFSLPQENSPRKTDHPTFLTPIRNRPHSLHVKPVYGVSGSKVCAVQEPRFPPRTISPFTGRDLTCKLAPELSTRYSANRIKGEAAVGIVPVTYEWKDKLQLGTANLVPATPLDLEVPSVDTVLIHKVVFQSQKDSTSDRKKMEQQILLQVLNRAGNSGVKIEKLPTLFSYLARNKYDSIDKNISTEKHTSLRKQGLPKINKPNHLRFSRPHNL